MIGGMKFLWQPRNSVRLDYLQTKAYIFKFKKFKYVNTCCYYTCSSHPCLTSPHHILTSHPHLTPSPRHPTSLTDFTHPPHTSTSHHHRPPSPHTMNLIPPPHTSISPLLLTPPPAHLTHPPHPPTHPPPHHGDVYTQCSPHSLSLTRSL